MEVNLLTSALSAWTDKPTVSESVPESSSGLTLLKSILTEFSLAHYIKTKGSEWFKAGS